MSRPTLTVEAALGSDPTVYTDISSYVRGVQIHRGRQYELDQIQTSTCSIELNNGDRRFDPTYTHSPHYPYVLPMRKVRVSATWNAVTYRLFTGYVERWPMSWDDGPRWGRVALSAVDGFTVLANAQLVGNQANMCVNSSLEASTDGWAVTAGTLTRNTNTPAYLGSASAQLTAGASSPAVAYPCGSPGAANGFQAGHVYRFTAAVYIPSGLSINNFDVWITLAYTINGNLHFDIEPAGSVTDQWQLLTLDVWAPPDGALTEGYAAVVFDETGATKHILIDAVKVEDLGAATEAGTADALALTRPQADLSETTTGQRIGTVLNAVGWGAAKQLAAGIETVQGVTLTDADTTNALAHVQAVEAADPGLFFMNGGGTAVFQDRRYRYGVAATVTLTDAAGSTGGTRIRYVDLQPDYDITHIVNDVTVTATGGAAQTFTDDSSAGTYFRRSNQLDLPLTSDAAAYQRAAFEVAYHKDPGLRFDSVTLKPASDPNAWPAALGLDFSDKVIVERTPGMTPAGTVETITQSCFVEAVTHDIGKDLADWTATFQLSPANAYENVWTLGTSRLGIDTVLAY